MEDIVIRPLKRGDVPQLVDLCREHCAYERTTWQELDQACKLADIFLSGESAWCWVVALQGSLVGYATASLELSTWHAAHYLHLDCLFLQENYRGKGLGQRLMARVAATAEAKQATNLQWQTPSWNTGAVGFYESLGAKTAAKLRFILDPRGYRAVVRDT